MVLPIVKARDQSPTDSNTLTEKDMLRLETIARKWFSDKPPPFKFEPDEHILEKLILKATKFQNVEQLKNSQKILAEKQERY